MPEHKTSQLSAYMDGELDARTQSEAAAHLASCQACSAELEALRRVSRVLRAAPQPEFMSTGDFTDRLMLQLPRREEVQHESAPSANWLLWLAPLIILAGWAFMQATLNLSGLIALAGRFGIMEGTLAWATGSARQTQWFAAAKFAGEAGLSLLNKAGVIANGLVTPLLWQAGAAGLYWAALALVMSVRHASAQQAS
jgi:anti-sigma factor RsiW